MMPNKESIWYKWYVALLLALLVQIILYYWFTNSWS
jgi:hypothetical protein